jgi:thiol:disulfide interchange protein DsbD
VTPTVAAPGDRVTIRLTATPDAGWHVYALPDPSVEPLGFQPTVIGVRAPAGWSVTRPVPSQEPITKESELEGFPDQRYHENTVEWTLHVNVPADASPGVYPLSGMIGYQACQTSCDFPTAARFATEIQVGSPSRPGTTALELTGGDYKQAATWSASTSFVAATDGVSPGAGAAGAELDLDNLQVEDFATQQNLAVVLVLAFLAGLILNFMPCVLPVVGLKIMAFVQQAGQSRGRIFTPNLWYTAGLISVFLILATLAVFFGLGWGEQFTSEAFNITLSAIVFVFALSFLGVWEIPIPGFVGSGKVTDLAAGEGPSAAFFKGVLTTVLATPCSGPLLAPALAFFVSQPAYVAYLGFGAAGLGMASPYLVIGAFPGLVSFLPKPGGWMDTFKHVMGFVLLGTVVFLMTFMEEPYVVPTLAFLVGLWAAFWWIGRVPLTEGLDAKLRAWGAATAFAVLIGLFSFTWLTNVMQSRFQQAVDRQLVLRAATDTSPVVATSAAADEGEHQLEWQPFSLDLLRKLTAAQKTVLVKFTADW